MSSFDIESLFQSIDIILTQRLNALSYDTTVLANIVDDSDKDNGHYIVSDGTIKFDAYASDTTYKTGDQVRVTVLNGDWSQKKFIEGKYSNKDTEGSAATYIPPLGTTLQTNLSQLNTVNQWTLYTNGSTYASNPFTKIIPKDSDFFNLQTNGIYDVLTIAADIQTNLGNLSAGNYGLRLDLLITPEVGSEFRIQKFITFDSSEMIGNPYTFVIDTHQEKRISIADLGHVSEIVVTPYQGIVIADDGSETPAPFLDGNGEAITAQMPIHFKNVVIGFGTDLMNVEDNSLKLYTPDLPFYTYNSGFGNQTNKKRLGFTWYNKTENDEYIGFSDGIADFDYDELDYLVASDFDSRLLAQLNKTGIASDETSLTLAANIYDAVPLMKSAYSNLTTGLSQALQRFGEQLAGANSLLAELEPLISSYTVKNEDGTETGYDAKLVQARNTAESEATLLEQLYTNILQYGYNVEKGIEQNVWEEAWSEAPDYYTLFVDAVNAGIAEVVAFLDFVKQETDTGKVLSGYRRIYNDYLPRINSEINKINTYIDQIPIGDDDLTLLKSYKVKTDYTPYHTEDFSQYANRYCVYWYRYNEGYRLSYIPPMSKEEWENNKTEHASHAEYKQYCDNNNIEYKYMNFLGDDWERLTVAYDLDENDVIYNVRPLVNFGLPTTAGEAPAADGNYYYPTGAKEAQLLTRWMDPRTESEKYRVVLFYNHEMVKSDVVVFNNSEEVPPQFKVNAGDVLRIEHDVDSRDHYQAYSSAYDLLNISDASRSRQLKCFYDGVIAGDEALADAEIYWYIPTNSTMLTYDKKFLIEKGFNTDADEKTPYSKDGYIYFNKKIKYTKELKEMTDEAGQPIYDSNGQILKETVVTINEADRYFFYKIKSYYESSAKNNTILVYAYVVNKEEPTKGEISFTFSTFGTNGTKYTLAITPATTQIAVLASSEEEGGEVGDLPLELTLYDANDEVLEMTTESSSDKVFYNLTTEWHAASAAAPGVSDQISNIEDSLSKKLNITGIISKYDGSGNYDTNRYIGIVKASVKFTGKSGNAANGRDIILSTLYPVPYASSPDLYISGSTAIVYNSQGTVSRLSEEPYCLYQHTLNGDIKVENQTWSLLYYDNKGRLLNPLGEEITESDAQIIAYLPTLNEDGTIRPSPMYYDHGNEFYIPVAVCRVDESIVWTQPIVISQNRYESSMLNDWDGGLVIDDVNGTIMATMIGAGKKDEYNRFNGVLMGDVVGSGVLESGNATGLGIYGFHQGAQSFNFSVNGTAFLGKAGAGRIIFDGNGGIIKSASYDNPQDAGMKIDLDDAWMKVRGSQKANGQAMIEINADADIYGAYFSIKSENSNKLVHIGTGTYYLQSDNYDNKGATDEVDNPGGAGMKIDLARGRIDAYNFRLNSKNVLINSSNNASSYFIVKDDNGNNLLYIGKNNYYLRSSGYSWRGGFEGSNTSGGMNIDLDSGRITAYNFELDAWDGIKGIYMSTDGSPYFKVGQSDGNFISVTKDLFEIQATNFLLNAWTEIIVTDENGNPVKDENGNDVVNGNGIYIDSDGSPYYFLVGSTGEGSNNYISLGENSGLDIRTTQFELDTPTLKISSGDETTGELPYIQILTGETENNAVLAHFAKDEMYLQNSEFDDGAVEGSTPAGLKIDIKNQTIQFGSATMKFQSDPNNVEKNHAIIEADEEKTKIGLTVTPRMYSPQVYVKGLYGGPSPYAEDIDTINLEDETMTYNSGISLMSALGDTGNRFPSAIVQVQFDEGFGGSGSSTTTTKNVNWLIHESGRMQGITAHNFNTQGQVLISNDKAHNAPADDTEYDPWLRVQCPAYIGQVKIENNIISNESVNKPITFASPVTFQAGQTLSFDTELNVYNRISIHNATPIKDEQGNITGYGDIKSTINLFAKEVYGFYNPLNGQTVGTTADPAPCLQIANHTAVSGLFYADVIRTDALYIYKNMIRCYDPDTPNKPNTILSFQPTGFTAYGNTIFEDLGADANKENTVTFQNAGGAIFSTKAEFNGGIYGTVNFYNRDENTSSSVNFQNTNMVSFSGSNVVFSGSNKTVTFSNSGGVTFNTLVTFGSGIKHNNETKTLGEMAFVDYVKKNFEIKLSGTISADNHSYYVETGEEEYTPIGEEFSFYKEAGQFTYIPIGTAYASEYVENYTGNVIKTNQTLYSAGTQKTAREESYTKITGYYAGTKQKYKTYTKEGIISLSMTGEKEITIEPSETEVEDISVEVSGCTVTIE